MNKPELELTQYQKDGVVLVHVEYRNTLVLAPEERSYKTYSDKESIVSGAGSAVKIVNRDELRQESNLRWKLDKEFDKRLREWETHKCPPDMEFDASNNPLSLRGCLQDALTNGYRIRRARHNVFLEDGREVAVVHLFREPSLELKVYLLVDGEIAEDFISLPRETPITLSPTGLGHCVGYGVLHERGRYYFYDYGYSIEVQKNIVGDGFTLELGVYETDEDNDAYKVEFTPEKLAYFINLLDDIKERFFENV